VVLADALERGPGVGEGGDGGRGRGGGHQGVLGVFSGESQNRAVRCCLEDDSVGKLE
jgi:hypothetical protein